MPEDPLSWVISRDIGLSSVTIWAVMMGIENPHPSVPLDGDDFGRCFRLLKKFPEWRIRLNEVSEKHPEWKKLVDDWVELEELYRHGGLTELLERRLKELEK